MGSLDFSNDTDDVAMAPVDLIPEASATPDVSTSNPKTLLLEDDDDDILLSNLVLDSVEKQEPHCLWIDDNSDDASLFLGLEDGSSVTSVDALLFDKFLLDDDDNDDWL